MAATQLLVVAQQTAGPQDHVLNFFNKSMIAGVFVLLAILMFLALFLMVSTILCRNRLEATNVAVQVLKDGKARNQVVETEEYTAFLPKDIAAASIECTGDDKEGDNKTPLVVVKVGCIYLPGALVDHRAYSRVAQKLAEKHGILMVVINSEPVRLVINSISLDFLSRVQNDLETGCGVTVSNWALGGHSIGAAEASRIAGLLKQQQQQRASPSSAPLLPPFQKYVLHGDMVPAPTSLHDSPSPILIVNATNDGFLIARQHTKKAFFETFPPQDRPNALGGRLTYTEIQGGNHSGFGDYPHQVFLVMDGARTISLEEQHNQIVESTAKFLLADEDLPSTQCKESASLSLLPAEAMTNMASKLAVPQEQRATNHAL